MLQLGRFDVMLEMGRGVLMSSDALAAVSSRLGSAGTRFISEVGADLWGSDLGEIIRVRLHVDDPEARSESV